MAGTLTNLHVSSADANITNTPVGGGHTISPNADPATVSAATIDSNLSSGNVTLTTVGSPNNGEPGDIVVDAGSPIGWTTASALTFNAAGSISINDIVAGSGFGLNFTSLVLNASGGTITQSAAIGAGTLTGSSSGSTTLTNANGFETLGDFSVTGGDFSLTDSYFRLTVAGAVSANSVTLTNPLGDLTLAAGGSITTTAGVTLTLQGAGSSANLAGVIAGSGGLTIAGSFFGLGANDTYHGQTLVTDGTLFVTGSIAASSGTVVANSGVLRGHGFTSDVHVQSGGILYGDSFGPLTTGSVSFDSGGHLQEALGASVDYVDAHGAVNLGAATLDLSLFNAFVPSPGESFTLINNDGTDPVIGTFAGLAQGSHITLRGTTGVVTDFVLNYQGGDGNDVTLTAAGGVPGDFNADKITDILWQGPGGSLSEWLMNVGSIANNLGLGSSGGLHFLAAADFNADGYSDVLWRDDGGNVSLWTMNTTQIIANQTVASIGGDWQNQGVADFNGDGHADVLWRNNNSGQVALWTMNGATITANQIVTSNLGADWHIQGLGDFNSDAKIDVLLRSSSGQVVLWTMNGAQITANQSVANLGLDWHVLGTGDFNHDGKSDILLRNDSVQVVLWTMDGNHIVANQNVANIDASWHLQGINDYTGDGNADVLWRNDNGQVALWEMNGAHLVSGHTVSYTNGQAAPIDQSWSVLHHQFDLV